MKKIQAVGSYSLYKRIETQGDYHIGQLFDSKKEIEPDKDKYVYYYLNDNTKVVEVDGEPYDCVLYHQVLCKVLIDETESRDKLNNFIINENCCF